MKVHQLVRGIKEGRIQLNPKKEVQMETFQMWRDDDDIPEK